MGYVDRMTGLQQTRSTHQKKTQKNLATRHSNNGELETQTDYILIDNKDRNRIANISDTTANPMNPTHRKMLIEAIKLNIRGNYFNEERIPTWPYDLNIFRRNGKEIGKIGK